MASNRATVYMLFAQNLQHEATLMPSDSLSNYSGMPLICSFQKISTELEYGILEAAEENLTQLMRELLTMELWASCLTSLYFHVDVLPA